MVSYSQDERIGSLKTPLSDELDLTRFSGIEGISEPFEFSVDAITTSKSVNFDDAIGKTCTVTFETIGQGKRYFAGTLTSTQSLDDGAQGEESGKLYAYRLTLRPWLWLLTKRANSRIFHDMTAPKIIGEIFKDYGDTAEYEPKLQQSYPKLEYCVQHRESDFAFVCRLMEANGISYHFEFSDGHQKLVLGDGPSSYAKAPGGKREYASVDESHNRKDEHLYQWESSRRFTTGKSTYNDYDFTKPSADLKAEVTGDASFEHGQLERYVHPGKYVQTSDGKNLSTAAIHAERAEDKHFIGAGPCASLAPGSLVSLAKHPVGANNGEYLVLRSTHYFETQAYRSGGVAGSSAPYRGTYEFLKSSIPYAPPMVTPRPVISGPQTAKVVGKGEIDCDEYGRILVHFHWNRKPEGKPEGQSMRCRVAQVWAGAKWGGIFIPRVNMEVLVEFIDGDPDSPVVVGALYNGDNKPPYPLPDKKNIAGLKSNSTEGGGGYNELVFDDTIKKELIRVHAEHDLDTTVEHDETRLIKNDRTTTIKHNDTLKVTNDILIQADHMITLKVGASTIVMDAMSITITSPTVSIDAKAEFKSHAGATSMHDAGGIYSIQAALVKVN
jgi:type VI secretion system secreted protein VgrG